MLLLPSLSVLNSNSNWGISTVPLTTRPRAHQSQSVFWCPNANST